MNKIKKSIYILFPTLFCLLVTASYTQTVELKTVLEKQLSSPDKNYEFVLQQKQDLSGKNSLNFKEKPIILDSGLDI